MACIRWEGMLLTIKKSLYFVYPLHKDSILQDCMAVCPFQVHTCQIHLLQLHQATVPVFYLVDHSEMLEYAQPLSACEVKLFFWGAACKKLFCLFPPLPQLFANSNVNTQVLQHKLESGNQ